MRLLLDEMYPPFIATQLQARGHDVIAVTARSEMRALPDDDVFAAAHQERRAVATENIADFSAIADAADRRGQAHHGLILIDPGKYPRGNPRTIGRLVTELDRLLNARRGEEPTSLRIWV